MKNAVLNTLKNTLIVSCQANEGEPLHDYPMICQALARAALEGGASGIRANYPENIASIRSITDVPIIGIYKKIYNDSEVYITPTLQEVKEIVDAGADIVAIDGTNRPRPLKTELKDLIEEVKRLYPDILLMADISTEAEGLHCCQLGVDIVATTLSGYTSYSRQSKMPDYNLVTRLAHNIDIPVIAEGKIGTPDQARIMIEIGAWSVVVGGAITRPQIITQQFVSALRDE